MRLTFFAFTETDIFTEDLLSITDDETLYAIQNALLKDPTLGDVMKGTSGARIRSGWKPKAKNRQKRWFSVYLYLSRKIRKNLSLVYL
jgi:hypothetical protein